jgi:ribose transport system permease protein
VRELKILGIFRGRHGFASIWWLTALLFAVSPLIATGSLDRSALLSMAPFAAILVIAAVGQTLVIQLAGIDLSVAGVITLSAVLTVKVAGGDDGRLMLAIVIAVGVAALVGLINGIAVTVFRITPLVATLGMNAILTGTVVSITASPINTPPGLSSFALDKTIGIPNTVWLALALVVVMAVVMGRTIWGRRLELTGENGLAARAAGIAVVRYRIGGYVVAAICYAFAGILLAGFSSAAGPGAGNDYLLTVISAVVLGGTSLTGGRGSVVASAGGALFMAQLNQVILARGAPSSVQFLIAGGVILLAMAARHAPLLETARRVTRPLRPRAMRPE